jgi:transcriptional regulator with XRE-family HTH domain
MDLGLTRKEAAKALGTNGWSVKHWEENLKSRIAVRFYPAILQFLGYDPWPEPITQGAAIRGERERRGWSRKRLAIRAGVDEATVRRIEENTARMARRPTEAIRTCLGL